MPRANDTVEAALLEYADLLSILSSDPYKHRAYEKAARAVGGYATDLAGADVKEILQVPNVGQGIRGGPTWERDGYEPHCRGIFDENLRFIGRHLSALQAEFDYSVPQFRMLYHPVLLMLSAGAALVAARIRLGRGAALGAVAFFIAVRGVLTLSIGPGMDHTMPHFPLYLAEALAVEAIALVVSPRRVFAFGAAAGAGIGTFGLAAEWGWSHVWMTMPWTAALLPEALVLAPIAALAGGLLGAYIGRALGPNEVRGVVSPAWAPVATAVAIGTSHGAYKFTKEAKLAFERDAEIIYFALAGNDRKAERRPYTFLIKTSQGRVLRQGPAILQPVAKQPVTCRVDVCQFFTEPGERVISVSVESGQLARRR